MLKQIIEKIFQEKSNWINKVKPKWNPPVGLFSKENCIKNPEKVANVIAKNSKDLKQAISRLNFFFNRNGICDTQSSHYDKEWCNSKNKILNYIHKYYKE